MAENKKPPRGNWLPAPAAFKLELACYALTAAFGHHFYQVGSSLERQDYRDVDVRCILPDNVYDHLFPAALGTGSTNAKWCVMSTAIAVWLKEQTGLDIDFQFQRQTEANAKHAGPRSALGVLLWGGGE